MKTTYFVVSEQEESVNRFIFQYKTQGLAILTEGLDVNFLQEIGLGAT